MKVLNKDQVHFWSDFLHQNLFRALLHRIYFIKGKSDLKMNLLVDFCHLSKSNWLSGTLYWRHIITKVWEVSFLLYELSSIWSRSALLVRFFFLQKIAGYWPWFGFSVYKLKSKTTRYYIGEKIGCFLKLLSIVALPILCNKKWAFQHKCLFETIMNSFTFPIENIISQYILHIVAPQNFLNECPQPCHNPSFHSIFVLKKWVCSKYNFHEKGRVALTTQQFFFFWKVN